MHSGLVAAKLLIVGLGGLIAYQGYRGYRRTEHPELFYVACGFTLISVGSILEGVLYDLMNWSLFTAGMVQSIVVAVGLIVILYSLFARFDDRPEAQ